MDRNTRSVVSPKEKLKDKSLAIFHRRIAEYRKPFFNRLVNHFKEVCIFHGGRLVDDVDFSQKIFEDICVARSFHFQHYLRSEASRFDVWVIPFDLHWISFLSLLFCDNGKKKKILWGHVMTNKKKQSRVALGIKRGLAKLADAIIFYNNERKDEFCAGDTELLEKSFTVPNTLEVSNRGRSASVARNSFLYVGRVDKDKNMEFLLDSFSSILSKLPQDIKLEIVGDGTELPRVKKHAKSLGLEGRISFYGAIHDNETLKPLFDRALVLCHPAPLGLIINHSFAFGVPILSLKDLPHGPEMTYLSEENSILCSLEEYPEKMRWIALHPRDVEHLGQNAISTFTERCSMDDMEGKFISAILSCYAE